MHSAEKKRLIRLLIVSAAVGAVALTYLYLNLPRIPCLFHELTGLNCPGCGNTRAARALVRLHFAESLSYNYAYPLEFIFLMTVIFGAAKNYVIKGKFSYYPKHPAFVWILLALILAWGVVRNILHV